MIIDSHCHIHDEKFAADLDQVLERARLAHISHLITIGCDIDTTKRAQALAHQFDQVFFTAGFHPHDAKALNPQSLAELKELAQDKKCVAIGEIGLDYYYLHSDKTTQQDALRQQLKLACDFDLPVVIHLRDAFSDCVPILKEHPGLLKGRVLIHCFTGSSDEAKLLEGLGCLISLSGVITFKKCGDLSSVAKNIALERLLVETDCPYLAPQPFRGQRNEPQYIKYTLAAIAQARNEDLSVICDQIYKNTVAFFGLPTSC